MPDAVSQFALSIVPATADVNAKAVCQFTVTPPGTEVTWTLKPQIGDIDANGIYTAPDEIATPQTVIVVATTNSGESATAAIDLTDAPKTIRFLAWYAIVIGVLLGAAILIVWNHLYLPPAPLRVIVNPPIVTLDAAKDEKFNFNAIVLGDEKNAVTWSVEGGGDIDSSGTFRQKPNPSASVDQTITVTARSSTDPSARATAVIHLLSGKHLEVAPQSVSAFTGQQIPFRTPNAAAKWSVSRSDIASISPDGVFTAGVPSHATETVQVTAWGVAPHEQAATAVILKPVSATSEFGDWPLMVFVILCGALGSMLYYASSFVSYVGNRTFRSSWFWFYISRPFVGGALALIFFFIVGSGLVTGATVTKLMTVGMVSALVGLFSDKAVKKLSDIVDVLLATKDDRKDKVTEVKSNTVIANTHQAVTKAPKISSATPASIPRDKTTTVTLKGTDLTPALKVKVNGRELTPSKPTDTGFELVIPAEQAVAESVMITVTTDAGTAAFDLPVK